jgi:hypothetical protein
MRMLHHSPTRSRLRAMGHCMLPKLLRCMDGRPSYLHDASHIEVAINMQALRIFMTWKEE